MLGLDQQDLKKLGRSELSLTSLLIIWVADLTADSKPVQIRGPPPSTTLRLLSSAHVFSLKWRTVDVKRYVCIGVKYLPAMQNSILLIYCIATNTDSWVSVNMDVTSTIWLGYSLSVC